MKTILYLFLLFVLVINPLMAGSFSNNENASSSGAVAASPPSEIPLRDKRYKFLQKREKDARELINEGRTLIKKGEKDKDENQILKGRIKLEIGQKQLMIVKEQFEQKKKEDQSNAF